MAVPSMSRPRPYDGESRNSLGESASIEGLRTSLTHWALGSVGEREVVHKVFSVPPKHRV